MVRLEAIRDKLEAPIGAFRELNIETTTTLPESTCEKLHEATEQFPYEKLPSGELEKDGAFGKCIQEELSGQCLVVEDASKQLPSEKLTEVGDFGTCTPEGYFGQLQIDLVPFR